MAASQGVSRRSFLKGASGAMALSLLGPRWSGDRAAAMEADSDSVVKMAKVIDYVSWEDVYRTKWKWDRIAKGTHQVNCWYQRCCNWNVFVKEGIVWREEQAGTYPQTNSEVPDFNPRGCQKGATFSERMYDDSRLRVPLKRVGERGEGKWKRVSWEEALEDIASQSLDVLLNEGPGAILWDEGSAGSNMGVQRTGAVLDTPILDVDSEFGDHHPGAAVTCGKISFASSGDDLHYSDLILIWGGNPTYTQIPNAHFINEARYNGAQVVTITPDYNASAIHADQWIAVNIASDAAFGLAMAHVMIEEGIYNAEFLKEQTDMPLLVRKDNHRFLRESDVKSGGATDVFYVMDESSQGLKRRQIFEAPKRSLALGELDPALEGETRIRTLDGYVNVVPVFELLRERLVSYTPEATESTTGVRPNQVRELARKMCSARAATCITQSNFGKFYHGLEMERAQFLVFALSGQFGKKGSGVNAFPNIWLSGHEGLIAGSGSLPPKAGLAAKAMGSLPELVMMKFKGYTLEMMMYELLREKHRAGDAPSSNLFLYFQGGLKDLYGSAKELDPYMKRTFDEHLMEAIEKGWQMPVKDKPRIFFEVGGNYLRRNRGYPKILEELFPSLDLVVTLDWRMSYT
ncbi:MAG: molybdopterin-dependent oxidoreductase, partial [Deltaproteobacteria bacterium]|nr:molybdopterin-dependent oxidoreductase [Deltaproteobacteria bacterium]